MSTGRGPTSDSYKMPIVMLSIGRSGLVRDPLNTLGIRNPLNLPDVLSNVGRFVSNYREVPSWESVQSFTFSAESDKMYEAEFELFDPDFDYLLSLFSTVYSYKDHPDDPDAFSVYYRWGWLVDGTTQTMSTLREGVIIGMEPRVTTEGMYLRLRVQQHITQSKAMNKINVTFDADTPAHLIVRAVMELDENQINNTRGKGAPQKVFLSRRLDALSTSTPNRVPRVNVGVDLQPLANSNQPVQCTNESAITFIRNTVLPSAVPVDVARQGLAVKFYEDDNTPGVYILTTESYKGEGPEHVRRIYDVRRSSLGQVLEYEVQDMSKIADILAGGGVVVGVDASKPKGQQVVKSEKSNITGDPLRTQGDTAIDVRHYHHSFDRNIGTIAQSRRVAWNNAANVAINASATIIGDPLLEILDYVRFNVYAGGTTVTAGRTTNSLQDRATTPRIVPWMSGVFAILGHTHHIQGGNYTTELSLVPSRQPKHEEKVEKEVEKEIPVAAYRDLRS